MRKLCQLSCALTLGASINLSQALAQNGSFGDATGGMGSNDKTSTAIAAGTNIATGTIAPTIPLLTLPGVSGGVALGLRYTAGAGVKVNDVASEVGLGWALTGGGAITREVKGQPDDGEHGWCRAEYYRNYYPQLGPVPQPGFPYETAGDLVSYFKKKDGNQINVPGNGYYFIGATEPFFPTYLYNVSKAASFSNYQFGQYTSVYTGTSADWFDTEPDVYTVMLPTGGLQFVLDGSGNPIVLQGQNIRIEALGVGNRTQTNFLHEFRITTSDGTQYLFGSSNNNWYEEKLKVSTSTTGTEPIPSKTDYECIYKWLLKKIITSTGEEINYNYDSGNIYEIVTNNHIQQDFVYALAGGKSDPNGRPIPGYTASIAYTDPWIRKYTVRTTAYSPDCKQLAAITTTQGILEFIYQATIRQDVGGGTKALTNLRLRNKAGILIKQLDFIQHYAQAAAESQTPPTDAYHLMLDKIIDRGTGCDYIEAFAFTYNPTTFCRNSSSKDDWGYFNNSSTPSTGELVNSYFYIRFLSSGTVNLISLAGRDRLPSLSYAQAMVLQSITTAQGGVQSFEYELHEANHSYSPISFPNTTMGGLRVKRISQYDGIDHANDIIENFIYQTPTGESSGSCGDKGLYAKLKFVHGQVSRHYGQGHGPYGSYTDTDVRQIIPECSYYNADPNSPFNLDSYYLLRSDASLYQYASDYIDYKYVTVDHGNKGKTQYEFTTWDDVAHQDYTDEDTRLNAGGRNPCTDDPLNTSRKPAMLPLPFSLELQGLDLQYPGGGSTADFPCRTSRAMERGLLLRTTQIGSNNQPVALTTNVYDFTHPGLNLPVVNAVVVKPDLEVLGFSQNFNYFQVYYYQHRSTWCPLIKTTQVLYDQQAAGDASKTLTSVTEIAYAHFFPSKITKYTVAGTSTASPRYVTEFRRAQDFPGGDADQMTTPGLLRKAGMMAPVIEQEDYLDQPNGTACSRVPKGAAFSEYKLLNDRVLPYKTYAARLGLTCFTPATTTQNGTVWTVTRDSNYELVSTVTGYTLDNCPVNTRDRSGVSQATIWGYGHTLPIATVTNGTASTSTTPDGLVATSAHTSLEEDGQNGIDSDGWSITALMSTTEAKTGNRSARVVVSQNPYSNGKALTLTAGANRHGKMTYSAWVKIPTGITSSTAMCLVVVGQGANSGYQQTCFDVYPGQDWKYVEAIIDLDEAKWQNGLANTDNLQLYFYQWCPYGSELLLDELRIHRTDALMQTTTYTPLVGKTSTTDPSGVTTYYTYDTNNNPRLILNQKHDIVQRTQQHLIGQDFRPSAEFSSPSVAIQDCAVVFAANYTTDSNCAGATYTWDFGDGATAVNGSATPQNTYRQPGTYTVSLLVADPVRGASRTTKTIDIFNVEFTHQGDTYVDFCDVPHPDPVTLNAITQGPVCQNITYQWQVRYQGSGNWTDIGTGQTLTCPISLGTKYVRCIVTGCGFNSEESCNVPALEITGYRSSGCPYDPD